jgi:hypothetical protein
MIKITPAQVWQRARVPVALVEILGASWSFVVMVRLLLATPGVVIPWTFLLIALGWFALVGLAGVRLLRQQVGGWTLSLIAQASQLFQLTAGSTALRLLAGPQLTIFYLGDRFYFFAGVTSSVNLFRGADDPPFAFGVNLVAVAILIVLACEPDMAATPHAA